MRQEIGAKASSPVQSDTMTMISATRFRPPHRFDDLSEESLPFSAELSAATLFPGQNVAVTTTSVTNSHRGQYQTRA